jgi:hypothetical protein
MTNSSPASAEKTTSLHLALLGGLRRDGVWTPRRRTIAISPVGGADLDLTQAVLPKDGEITITKISLVGGVHLRVPADVNVVVEGFNLIGGRPDDLGPHRPDAPTVRLFAYGLFGGVRVDRAG